MTNDNSKTKTPAWTSATSAATEKGGATEEKKTGRPKITQIEYSLVTQDKPNDVVNCGPEKPRYDTEKMKMLSMRLEPELYDAIRTQAGASNIVAINALLRFAIDTLNVNKQKILVK